MTSLTQKRVGVGLSSGTSPSTGSSIKVSHAAFNQIIVKSENFYQVFRFVFFKQEFYANIFA